MLAWPPPGQLYLGVAGRVGDFGLGEGAFVGEGAQPAQQLAVDLKGNQSLGSHEIYSKRNILAKDHVKIYSKRSKLV